MKELPQVIPDVQMLLALTPEELAAKMLFLLRKRSDAMFHPGNLENELWNSFTQPRYAREYEKDSLALAEAWAWLHAQGLVVPEADINGQNGWRLLVEERAVWKRKRTSRALSWPEFFRAKSCILRLPILYGERLCEANLMLRHFKP